MRLSRLIGPTAFPVSLAAAKQHLRVISNDDDDLISLYIGAATEYLDGEAGLLSRCLAPQTWLAAIDGTWPREIEIPLPPLIEVEVVKYVDPAGSLQVLDPAAYVVLGAHGHDPARIVPAPGVTWPATRYQEEAVAVKYRAGYVAGSPEEIAVPAPIKTAILAIVADRYAFREINLSGTIVTSVPQGALDALVNYRKWL